LISKTQRNTPNSGVQNSSAATDVDEGDNPTDDDEVDASHPENPPRNLHVQHACTESAPDPITAPTPTHKSAACDGSIAPRTAPSLSGPITKQREAELDELANTGITVQTLQPNEQREQHQELQQSSMPEAVMLPPASPQNSPGEAAQHTLQPPLLTQPAEASIYLTQPDSDALPVSQPSASVPTAATTPTVCTPPVMCDASQGCSSRSGGSQSGGSGGGVGTWRPGSVLGGLMGRLGSIGRKCLRTSPISDSLPVVAPPRLLEVRCPVTLAIFLNNRLSESWFTFFRAVQIRI
jgi:hypothetical protein